MKALLILLLFGILTAHTETAFAQSSIPDSCICYTDKQDANCLECLNNLIHFESIICEQENKIAYRDSIIEQNIIKADALSVEYEHQKEIADDNAKKLNRCRKWSKIKNTAFGIGGALIGWVVRKTLFN